MNTILFASVLLLSTMAVVGASGVPRLEGMWDCESAIVNGKPLPEKTVQQLRLTLTKDRYKTEKAGEVLFDSTYTIDSSKTPTQIDLVGTEGDIKGKLAQGILVAYGNTLKICYTMPGKTRPKTFESPEGSEIYFIVWKLCQSAPGR